MLDVESPFGIPEMTGSVSTDTPTEATLSGVSSLAVVRREMIALTYDDGPSKDWTPKILDLLEKYDAKATFFVCGNAIQGNEKILKRTHREGHEIGNHTMTHRALPRLGKMETFTELVDCSQRITEVIGEAPRFYRPPYLKNTPVATAVGEAIGMVPVGCDVIANDWADPSPSDIAARVVNEVVYDTVNPVVLLHDGRPLTQLPHADGGSLDTRAHVIGATELILATLKAKGYEFVTLSELVMAHAAV